ncbi:MAG: hypothetical protein JWM68_927 [Verrucomicrobiales bacterium]|nr:hypothetical protein [Verrucomicrobiales bacterium]
MLRALKKTVELNCSKPEWKVRLKTALQEKRNVTLINLDYTQHGLFCETLSVAHRIPFSIDYKKGVGLFTWH